MFIANIILFLPIIGLDTKLSNVYFSFEYDFKNMKDLVGFKRKLKKRMVYMNFKQYEHLMTYMMKFDELMMRLSAIPKLLRIIACYHYALVYYQNSCYKKIQLDTKLFTFYFCLEINVKKKSKVFVTSEEN